MKQCYGEGGKMTISFPSYIYRLCLMAKDQCISKLAAV